jgi:hypothetical protein
MSTMIHGPWVEQQIDGTWHCLAKFEFELEDSYYLFGLMAGVRLPPGGRTEFPPRGFPHDASWQVVDAYTRIVSLCPITNDGRAALMEAERWLDEGRSVVWSMNDVCQRITAPHYHHASWLTPADFDQVIKLYGEVESSNLLNAIAAFIRKIERPARPCRLVFWFDS